MIRPRSVAGITSARAEFAPSRTALTGRGRCPPPVLFPVVELTRSMTPWQKLAEARHFDELLREIPREIAARRR